MDGVTDCAFRQMQAIHGHPDIVFTEFTSVEGLCRKADRLLTEFLFTEDQRPIVAQIYGTTPDFFRQVAVLVCHLGFDGVDINMGCPAKNVAHSGAGAALIQSPKLAQEIITATKLGVTQWQDGLTPADCPNLAAPIVTEVEKRHKTLPEEYQRRNRNVPVSVKTRIGYDAPVVSDWIPVLLESEIAALSLHGRTLRQAYSGMADWEAIALAADLARNTQTLILGNGDIQSREQALEYAAKYQVDGVLIGRATFGNPFVFSPTITSTEFSDLSEQISPAKRAQLALEHAQLFEQYFSHLGHYSFLPMRKHLGWYISGMDHAKEIRIKLVQTNNSQEVKAVLEEYQL